LEHGIKYRFAALVGLVDRFGDDWRVAVGPTLATGANTTEWGVEMPLYASLLTLPGSYTGEYKGILKVVPRAQWSRKGGEPSEFRFTLALELLSQRSLIPRAADFLQQ
jgi:hypothetical protein